MTLIGVELKWPAFWPLTQAVAVAAGLWLLLTVSPLGAKDAFTAGGNFAAICFGCVSNVIGIEVKRGGRHLALNIAGCALILVAYHAVAAFF
jgi:hypothetical protein